MFNEGVVNARDQVVRLQSNPNANQVTKLNSTLIQKQMKYQFYNDGDGILIEKHSSGVYNPELTSLEGF